MLGLFEEIYFFVKLLDYFEDPDWIVNEVTTVTKNQHSKVTFVGKIRQI